MARALKCDRCGGFFDLLKETREYRIEETTVQKPSCQKTVDLCPDCYTTFTKWLTGENLISPDPISDLADSVYGTGELYPGEFETMRGDKDRWCNTCEYKHLESECLGCAEYDEYDILIDLRNYKKEESE